MAKLTDMQVRTLRMAKDRYIKWTGPTPQTLRGVGKSGLIELSPDNETTYRCVAGLERRGLLRHGFTPDDDVAWALTLAGRDALEAAISEDAGEPK